MVPSPTDFRTESSPSLRVVSTGIGVKATFMPNIGSVTVV
jgi:hypothetical protein